MNRLLRMFLLSMAALLLCSCAASSPVVKPRMFWPSPPSEPKFEWVGAYSSEAEMRADDAKSLFDLVIGEEASQALRRPMSVASDGKGKVYVTDAEATAAYVFDFNEKKIVNFGGKEYEKGLTQVNGVSIDAAGNVYVSDSKARKIFVTTPLNEPLKVIDVSAHINFIGRFAIDKINGRIVMPDVKKHQIVITDMNGKHIKSFGRRGDDDGNFNLPIAVAIEKDGGIVVADSLNARIQRFTSNGEFVNKMGRRGDGPGDLALIKGVAVDSGGNIYVTDGKDHRITIFSTKGELLMVLGGAFSQTPGTRLAVGGFLVPQGIFIDQNDRIYVVDQLNKRIQIFQYLNENYLAKYPLLPVGTSKVK